MTELKSEGGKQLKYPSKYVCTKNEGKRKLWRRKSVIKESQYCYEDDNEDCYSEETFDTYNCYICNVEVPVLCFKKHNESEKHVTLKAIFQKVLERVSKQINMSVINNDKDIDEDVYYCVPCSKIIKIENKHKHELSQHHVKSQRDNNVVLEFCKIFEENKAYVDVKEVENEEIFEKRDLSANNYGTEIIQNDSKNNNKNVTNEDKSNNDETKTVCSTNDHTMKPTSAVEHLVPNDKLIEELTSEENYFKYMVKKYNLKVNVPIVDGEFIHVASPSGVTVKISRDNFHSFYSTGIKVHCGMCKKVFFLREESKHKVSEEHASKVFLPVNEQFARTVDDNFSHCLICNMKVRTSDLFEHHEKHVKLVELYNRLSIIDISLNNEDLANSINTENNIEQAHEKNHTIENHVNKSEENKIIECINNKEYICKVNLSENDLGNHLSESGHIARTEDATSVQKMEFCKLCNVSVLQDQMEYHNAGTPHWSNAMKNICTGVADVLQAYFTKDNLKTDSVSYEKQKDVPKNENVAKQTDIPKNENVAKQTDIPKNENVAKQTDIPKNENVAKQTDIPKNENVAKQTDIPKNENVAKQTDIPKNENVAQQTDIPKNENVAKQTDIPKNENVAKQTDIPKNENVAQQTDIPKNENVASTSVSNIINNEIDCSSPFRYADTTKNKVTCVVCDIDFANVQQNITKHEASSIHKLWLRKLLHFHTIRKNSKSSLCECCCDINVTNIWAHIRTERHTALLQLEYEIETKALKLYNYKSNIRNGYGIMSRELYKMLLESNKIYKLPNSNFYCTFCELELVEGGNEIDHMFSVAHETWLKNIFKSR